MYLIIGASSFIGRHLYEYCKKNKVDILGTCYTHSYNPEWIRFDICSDDLDEICSKYLPGKPLDAVIICSADSNIDYCKLHEEESYRTNVIGAERVLKQADAMGVKSVFFSSEAVFDGDKGFYSENDIPNPITVYGNQKLEVENFIKENIKNYLIVRISKAIGSTFGENDIFEEFYNKIIHNETIVCLKNQSRCFTEVNDIAKVILAALELKMSGLYHVSSPNYMTRYELGNMYSDKLFGEYKNIVEKPYQDMTYLDNRYIYGGLNGEKLSNILKFRYMDMEEIINRYYETFQQKSEK